MLKRPCYLMTLSAFCVSLYAQDAIPSEYYSEAFPKAKVLSNHLIIDGNTGEIIEGTTRFTEGAKVQIIVTKPNPFKYTYQVRTRSQPLDAAIALQFLGLAGLPDTVASKLGISPDALPGACDGPQTAKWTPYTDRLKKVKEDYAKLLADVNAAIAAQKKLKDFKDATDVDSIVPADIPKRLLEAKALVSLSDSAEYTKRVSTLLDDASKLQTDVAGAISGSVMCDSAQRPPFTDGLPKITAGGNDIKSQLDVYTKAKPELDPIYKVAQSVANEPTPFLSVSYPDTSGGPRGVTVDVSRQNIRSNDSKMTPLATYQLNVGESRLSLSAGIGFSSIRERAIIRQASAGDTADTTVTRFGYNPNSSFHPNIVVQLNGHLWQFSNMIKTGQPGSIGLSTGVVVANRADSTEVEYLAGISFGFLRNIIVLTPAFHAARVQELAGGFKIGDKIPTTLQDPLPIQKNFQPGFILTITFKIR